MTTTMNGKYEYEQYGVRISDEYARKIESNKKQIDEQESNHDKDLLVSAMEINVALYLLSKYPKEYEVKCRVEMFMGEPRPEYYLIQIRNGDNSRVNCYNRYWIVYSKKQYIYAGLFLADWGCGIMQVEKALNILAHNDSYIIKTCREHIKSETFTSFFITRSDSYDSKRDIDVYRPKEGD